MTAHDQVPTLREAAQAVLDFHTLTSGEWEKKYGDTWTNADGLSEINEIVRALRTALAREEGAP